MVGDEGDEDNLDPLKGALLVIWIQVNFCNFIYLNCMIWRYKNRIDRRSYAHNLNSCEIKDWRKIQAWMVFDCPMASAIPVQCSANWAIKPTGSWSHCEFVIYLWMVKNTSEYLKFHIFELRRMICRYDWSLQSCTQLNKALILQLPKSCA